MTKLSKELFFSLLCFICSLVLCFPATTIHKYFSVFGQGNEDASTAGHAAPAGSAEELEYNLYNLVPGGNTFSNIRYIIHFAAGDYETWGIQVFDNWFISGAGANYTTFTLVDPTTNTYHLLNNGINPSNLKAFGTDYTATNAGVSSLEIDCDWANLTSGGLSPSFALASGVSLYCQTGSVQLVKVKNFGGRARNDCDYDAIEVFPIYLSTANYYTDSEHIAIACEIEGNVLTDNDMADLKDQPYATGIHIDQIGDSNGFGLVQNNYIHGLTNGTAMGGSTLYGTTIYRGNLVEDGGAGINFDYTYSLYTSGVIITNNVFDNVIAGVTIGSYGWDTYNTNPWFNDILIRDNEFYISDENLVTSWHEPCAVRIGSNTDDITIEYNYVENIGDYFKAAVVVTTHIRDEEEHFCDTTDVPVGNVGRFDGLIIKYNTTDSPEVLINRCDGASGDPTKVYFDGSGTPVTIDNGETWTESGFGTCPSL